MATFNALADLFFLSACVLTRVSVCLQDRKSVCVSAREKECVCVCPLRTRLKNFKVVQWLKSAGRLKLHRHENMNAAAAAAEAAGNKKIGSCQVKFQLDFLFKKKFKGTIQARFFA